MEKKIKIGIYTFTAANNYGAVLQAYALKQYLSSTGYDAHCMDYRPTYLTDRFKPFSTAHINMGRGNIFRKFIREIVSSPLIVLKNHQFERFKKKYLDLCPIDMPNIDLYIVGSDQVWNYGITHGDPVFLGVIPGSQENVISYAASMEKNVSQEYLSHFVSHLANFRAISVREPELKDLIKSLNNRPCTHVVDPTLLLSANDWRKISKPYRNTNGDYIFMYGFNFSKKDIDAVNIFAKKNNIKVIKASSGVKLSEGFSNDISPEQFLHVVEHAKYVITNSFHGTAFSVIFCKDYLQIARSDLKKNTRVEGLLELIGVYTKPFDTKNDITKNKFIRLQSDNQTLRRLISNSEYYLRINI